MFSPLNFLSSQRPPSLSVFLSQSVPLKIFSPLKVFPFSSQCFPFLIFSPLNVVSSQCPPSQSFLLNAFPF